LLIADEFLNNGTAIDASDSVVCMGQQAGLEQRWFIPERSVPTIFVQITFWIFPPASGILTNPLVCCWGAPQAEL